MFKTLSIVGGVSWIVLRWLIGWILRIVMYTFLGAAALCAIVGRLIDPKDPTWDKFI